MWRSVRVTDCILRFPLVIYTQSVLPRPAFVRLCVRVRVFVNLFCANIHPPTHLILQRATRDPSRVTASAEDPHHLYHPKTIIGPAPPEA